MNCTECKYYGKDSVNDKIWICVKNDRIFKETDPLKYFCNSFKEKIPSMITNNEDNEGINCYNCDKYEKPCISMSGSTCKQFKQNKSCYNCQFADIPISKNHKICEKGLNIYYGRQVYCNLHEFYGTKEIKPTVSKGVYFQKGNWELNPIPWKNLKLKIMTHTNDECIVNIPMTLFSGGKKISIEFDIESNRIILNEFE